MDGVYKFITQEALIDWHADGFDNMCVFISNLNEPTPLNDI